MILILLALLFLVYSTFLHATNVSQVPLTVMTFNIENGGTGVDFDKVVEAVKKSKADVVGIQEAWGHTPLLAKKLGWKYVDVKQHILSRYPLYKTKNKSRVVFIEVKPNRYAVMTNMHLPDEPYGPDLIQHHASYASVIANERKVRVPTALPYIQEIAPFAQKGFPIFLTGDFNSPSHLDWTQATVHRLRNHHYPVTWQVTKIIETNHLIDSYRAIHPDPVKDPSYTWPSGRPNIKNSIDGYNPSANDLPDRIDFIFSGGPAKVINSQIAGNEIKKDVHIAVTPWPSDHRAVVSTFEIQPAFFSKKNLLSSNQIRSGKVRLFVSNKIYHAHNAILITWVNAPGNGYDYVTLFPTGSSKTSKENAVRLYTHGKVNGNILFAANTAKGNWQAWNISTETQWPLQAGKYDVNLMVDDSYDKIASTQFRVQ